MSFAEVKKKCIWYAFIECTRTLATSKRRQFRMGERKNAKKKIPVLVAGWLAGWMNELYYRLKNSVMFTVYVKCDVPFPCAYWQLRGHRDRIVHCSEVIEYYYNSSAYLVFFACIARRASAFWCQLATHTLGAVCLFPISHPSTSIDWHNPCWQLALIKAECAQCAFSNCVRLWVCANK